MSRMLVSLPLLAVMVLAVMPPAATAARQPGSMVLQKNRVIPVVLDNRLSSRSNRAGDRFEAHAVGNSRTGFPRNTTFVGVVREAIAKSGNQPGRLKLRFTEAILPDGRRVAIDAVPSSRTLAGRKQKSANAQKYALYGAGAGLLLSRNKLKGVLIGGGLGYLAGTMIKGKASDVDLSAGTELNIRLIQSVSIPY